MATAQEQIDAIKDFCSSLERDPDINVVILNDWGRFGNFDVHVYPVNPQTAKNSQVKAIITKAVRQIEGAHLRRIFAPDVGRKRYFNRKRGCFMVKPSGRLRDFWTVDVDYMQYDPETNSFSA